MVPVAIRSDHEDALTRNQTRLLGVVLNRFESKYARYGYGDADRTGYGYGFGYGFGYGSQRSSSEGNGSGPDKPSE